MKKWVEETIKQFESVGEEKYFCTECGFTVIMPVVVDVRNERCNCCGNESTRVGLKNLLAEKIRELDGTIHDTRDTMLCPFHMVTPHRDLHLRLIRTAYKRGDEDDC